MSDPMPVTQGISARFTVFIRGGDRQPYTGYTGSEALAASVRVGRDAPALFAPVPVWLSAAAGTITLPFAGSDTATVEPGRYLVQIRLADDSADLFEGLLDVAYSTGTAAELPTYGSYGDMLDIAPAITKFQKDTDLAGFARQRAAAREWFDDLLHRHYRYSGGPSTDFAFVPGVSFSGSWGGLGFSRDGRRSRELQEWLDADGLDVTSAVRDAVTNYAVALIYDRQAMSVGGDKAADFDAMARKFFGRATDGAADISAEVDSDGDGTNDVIIRLGLADTLEG